MQLFTIVDQHSNKPLANTRKLNNVTVCVCVCVCVCVYLVHRHAMYLRVEDPKQLPIVLRR